MLKSTGEAVKAICQTDPTITAAQVKAALAELNGEGLARVMDTEPPPRIYTIREVAALLQCTPATIRAYARRGLLVPIRISKSKQRVRLYTAESVHALMNGGDKTTAEGSAS